MNAWIATAWVSLGLIHVLPAAVVVRPGLTQRLYGVPADGEVGVLLVHRGVLFLAIVAVTALATLDPTARRAASLVVAISVVGFLVAYTSAGSPQGALRTIAIVDAIALLPLGLVLFDAWRPA
ncbi:MAG: hypothetical protein AAGA48_31285 [Myxococcota bacterium]